MRKAMEQMLYDNGVDIFFSGHIHAYEVGMFGSRARKDTEALPLQWLANPAQPAPRLTS